VPFQPSEVRAPSGYETRFRCLISRPPAPCQGQIWNRQGLFDHVTIRVADLAAAVAFYEPGLRVLGFEPTTLTADFAEWEDLSILAGPPVTTRLHLGFSAPTREAVDEYWRLGTAAGHRDDGAPGPRPQYSETYYGGFLLDPDGNSAEAVHHGTVSRARVIDHLWIRVADLRAARDFYALVGRFAGYELRSEPDDPPRAHFSAGPGRGSFSVVDDGAPAANVHLAFPAADDATVDAFHAALTGAGYRDNGSPGERRQYHPGYYGAFVLDPDGNNVELVNHNR
jgi:catechol 2,3-dioxygenase-like lactoylglutathione lyase family enzyme